MGDVLQIRDGYRLAFHCDAVVEEYSLIYTNRVIRQSYNGVVNKMVWRMC